MKYWNWRPADGTLNFGDELTGLLLGKIFPYERHQWVEPGEAELIAVGSILHTIHGSLKPGTKVWGTGGGYSPDDVRGLEILAVRGAVTRDLCGLPKDTVLGDPAILLPLYFEPAQKKHYKVGFVRHMGDIDPHHNIQRDLDISCLDHPLDVIKAITSCEMIVSSSLHGWIVAHAYGIPATPVPFGGFEKFADFMSSFEGQSLESARERLLGQLQG